MDIKISTSITLHKFQERRYTLFVDLWGIDALHIACKMIHSYNYQSHLAKFYEV